MIIQEAANRWNVKENTVFDYISKGYIYGLAIDNNEIIIPDIPKPYIKKKPKTVTDQDNYILTAMNKGWYANAKIMGIDQDKFEERLNALIKANKIFSKSSDNIDYSSTLGFVLSNTDTKKIDVTIAPSIDIKPTLEIKFADQIGIANGKVG